jgi:hypothetical protein
LGRDGRECLSRALRFSRLLSDRRHCCPIPRRDQRFLVPLQQFAPQLDTLCAIVSTGDPITDDMVQLRLDRVTVLSRLPADRAECGAPRVRNVLTGEFKLAPVKLFNSLDGDRLREIARGRADVSRFWPVDGSPLSQRT